MQFTAKAVKQRVLMLVIAVAIGLVVGLVGVQLLNKPTQISYPQVSKPTMLKITNPPSYCPTC